MSGEKLACPYTCGPVLDGGSHVEACYYNSKAIFWSSLHKLSTLQTRPQSTCIAQLCTEHSHSTFNVGLIQGSTNHFGNSVWQSFGTSSLKLHWCCRLCMLSWYVSTDDGPRVFSQAAFLSGTHCKFRLWDDSWKEIGIGFYFFWSETCLVMIGFSTYSGIYRSLHDAPWCICALKQILYFNQTWSVWTLKFLLLDEF